MEDLRIAQLKARVRIYSWRQTNKTAEDRCPRPLRGCSSCAPRIRAAVIGAVSGSHRPPKVLLHVRLPNSCIRTYGDLLLVIRRRGAKRQRHNQHNGNSMNVSFIQHVSIRTALTLVFLIGSANAAAYSWTEILIPSIGPLGPAF